MPAAPALDFSFGIQKVNNLTIENLTAMSTNLTDPVQFFSNVNQAVYSGLLYFSLMIAFVFICYMALQQFQNRPLVNMMYGCTLASLIGFFLRVVEFVYEGQKVGLINDFQMWIFPLISVSLAAILWAIKDK